eukprot:Em0016g1138a
MYNQWAMNGDEMYSSPAISTQLLSLGTSYLNSCPLEQAISTIVPWNKLSQLLSLGTSYLNYCPLEQAISTLVPWNKLFQL